MAWLTGWNYRKATTITNTGSALTDYQVSITVDTASLITALKMRSDCGDIRFTDSDGSTLRYYWIESGCNTVSTIIWAKIPFILAGTNTIYMYYGNATPPSDGFGSSGTNTFDFFDDFETGLWTDRYTAWGNLGTVSYDYAIYKSGIRSLSLSQSANIRGGIESKSTLPMDSGKILEFWYRTTGGGYFPIDGVQLFGSMGAGMGGNINYIHFGRTDYDPISSIYTISANKWYKVVIYEYPGNATFKVYDSDGVTQLYTKSGAYTYDSTNGTVYLVVQNPHTGRYDNLKVRKYASTEPTSSISGTEELPIGYLDISSTPTDADIYTDSTFRGRTPSLLSLPIGSYNLKVSKTGYIDYTETIIITEGFTLTRSVTLISLSNITATNVTLDHVTPCIEGTCIVTANVTWTNSGTGSGDFVPNIKIDNIAQTPVYPSQSLAASASVTKSFPIIGLPIGTHTICPYPN